MSFQFKELCLLKDQSMIANWQIYMANFHANSSTQEAILTPIFLLAPSRVKCICGVSYRVDIIIRFTETDIDAAHDLKGVVLRSRLQSKLEHILVSSHSL